MADKIRAAVIGLGRIGWYQHCAALARHRDFQLVAGADPLQERCDELRATFGCRGYSDYRQMLEDVPLDAVVVASPTHLHKPMALAAFKRGLHVLLEKPMALNYREALSIVRAARRHGCVMTVYQPHRLAAYFQHTLKIIRSGLIGRVVRAQVGLFDFARRNDWQSLRKFGGGMLSNYGAHALDQLLQLVGYDIKRVRCHLQLIASLGDAEDAVKVLVQTRSGVIGDVDISQASTINPYRIIVWGTCGAIQVDEAELRLRYFDPRKLTPKKLDLTLASAGRKYCSEQIEFVEKTIPVDKSLGVDVYSDFASAIRQGREPFVRPEETLALMRLLDQCREDAGRIARLRL